MIRLIFIIFLNLIFLNKTYAKEPMILIQCKSDNPDFAIFRPIYEINLETKKAKAGGATYYVIKYDSNEILIGDVNAVMEVRIIFNRNNGKYMKTSRFFGKTKEEEKKIIETGICAKKEKAF